MTPRRWAAGMVSRPNLAIAVAAALLVASVALPPIELQRPTYRYLMVFDVTQSMDVPDQTVAGVPASRLAAAKAAAREALRELPCGSQLGWGVFADYRVMALMLPVEVCRHYDGLLASLDQIDGRMRWANASNIGKGASWVVRTARTVGANTHVVFFTDGQESPPLRSSTDAPPIQDITPGAVGGWIVGVGGDAPARIPRTDADGQSLGYWEAADVVQRYGPGTPGTAHEHLSELREPHLKSLAKMLGLDYLRLASLDGVGRAMRDPAQAQPEPVRTDLRWIPALLGLALLAARFTPDGLARSAGGALRRRLARKAGRAGT